jgi:hypothetical protein
MNPGNMERSCRIEPMFRGPWNISHIVLSDCSPDHLLRELLQVQNSRHCVLDRVNHSLLLHVPPARVHDDEVVLLLLPERLDAVDSDLDRVLPE